MSVEVFGVTHAKVQTNYFPGRSGGFTTSSTPTSSVITDFVQEEAGLLAGRLLKKGVTVAAVISGVTEGTSSTWTAAYVWCRKFVTLAAAIRVLSVTTSGAADGSSKWGERLDAMLEVLDRDGAAALGDEGLDGSASGPAGPSGYIDELSLDVGDEATAASSPIVPDCCRKDAEL